MLDKAIVMIGGGKLQMPALRWAREAGLKVLLVDKNISDNKIVIEKLKTDKNLF